MQRATKAARPVYIYSGAATARSLICNYVFAIILNLPLLSEMDLNKHPH